MNPQTKPCPHQWRHGIRVFDYGDDIFLAIGNWQNAGFIWHQMYFCGGGCGVLAGNERLGIKLWGINIQLGRLSWCWLNDRGHFTWWNIWVCLKMIFPSPKWWSSNLNSNFERYAPCSDPPIVTKLIQVELSLDWLKDNLQETAVFHCKHPWFPVDFYLQPIQWN